MHRIPPGQVVAVVLMIGLLSYCGSGSTRRLVEDNPSFWDFIVVGGLICLLVNWFPRWLKLMSSVRPPDRTAGMPLRPLDDIVVAAWSAMPRVLERMVAVRAPLTLATFWIYPLSVYLLYLFVRHYDKS